MSIEFPVVRKVLHHEWDEVTIPPREFFMLWAGFFSEATEDEYGDPLLNTYDHYPTFNFDNGTVVADEMWGVRGDRVYTSSDASGIMGWKADKGQYTSLVYGRETELGAFISATFTLRDGLREALESLGTVGEPRPDQHKEAGL